MFMHKNMAALLAAGVLMLLFGLWQERQTLYFLQVNWLCMECVWALKKEKSFLPRPPGLRPGLPC